MFMQLFQAGLLIAITVTIHGMVLTGILAWLRDRPVGSYPLWQLWRLLSVIAILCIFAHVAEIVVWAGFFVWQDVMPDLELATYFSAVTYATIGYGDITPPDQWRLLASVEGLTGILMCAWSGGFFFAVVTHIHKARDNRNSQ